MRKPSSPILVITALLLLIVTSAVIVSCGDEETTATGPSDNTPPARIRDLSVEVIGNGDAVKLYFTAVGDDSLDGSAKLYRLHYSHTPIDDSNWQDTYYIDLEETPGEAGMADTVYCNKLQSYHGYFLALRACDEAGNCSEISNLAVCFMSSDGYWHLPGTITDLAVGDVSLSNILLIWTAPGVDSIWGIVSSYEVRYGSDSATVTSGDSVQVQELTGQSAEPGQPVSCWVRGLLPEHDYFFAVAAKNLYDAAGPISNLQQVTTISWPDTIPPARVTDLRIIDSAEARITLSWSAPGDDSLTGVSYSYDIRWANVPLSESNWNTAQPLIAPESPAMPGETETFQTERLDHNTEYYFGVKACDDVGLCAGISNIVHQTVMWDDTIPPPVITDLSVTALGAGQVRINWTSPADQPDGDAVAAYDLRYSTRPIGEINFETCTVVETGHPAAVGTTETAVLAGLDSYRDYYFAIRSVDEYDFTSPVSEDAHIFYLPADLSVSWPVLPDSIGVDRVLDFSTTQDGGVLILFRPTWPVSHDADIALLKADSQGNTVWQRTYGGPAYDDGVGILRLTSGYVLVASTESYGAGEKDIWLVWIDEAGNVNKDLTLGDSLTQYATACAASPTGGFAVGGVSSTIPGAFVAMLDNSGGIRWTEEHSAEAPCLGHSGSKVINGVDFSPSGVQAYTLQSNYWEGHPSPGTGEWVCEPWSNSRLMLVPSGGSLTSIFGGSGYPDSPVYIKEISHSGGSTWLFHYYDRYSYIDHPYGELFCWDESASLVWKETAPKGYVDAVTLGLSRVVAVVEGTSLQLIFYPAGSSDPDRSISVGTSVQAGGIVVDDSDDLVVAGSALKDGLRQLFILKIER